MRVKEIIVEGAQHPIIVVDVQPEYVKYGGYSTQDTCKEIINFVQKQTGPVLMFVNAEHTGVSDDTVQSIKQYWEETVNGEPVYDKEYGDYVAPDQQINWSRFRVVDKGYGYFRSWLDYGITPATIIRVIRAMYQAKITDSRDLPDLEKIVGDEWEPRMYEDSLSVKWTSIAQLKRFNNAYLVGGGRDECLREVELLMNAFNISYKRIDRLVY